MTYHRPLFTGNVLKVRLSCEKNFQKKKGEKSVKNHGKGKKNQDRVWIYYPVYTASQYMYSYSTHIVSKYIYSSCTLLVSTCTVTVHR